VHSTILSIIGSNDPEIDAIYLFTEFDAIEIETAEP